MGYVIAAYAVVLIAFASYVFSLARRRRALTGSSDSSEGR